MKIYRDNGNYRMRDGWRLTTINGGMQMMHSITSIIERSRTELEQSEI